MRMHNLTRDNYFSIDADRKYMSVSQYKSFREEYGGCEAMAVAKLNGEYIQPPKEVFLEGSYVHSWNDGTQDEFKANNPDMYSSQGATKGQLKSTFKHCNKMIEVLESDPFALKALAGEKEIIFTAEMFGTQWKIMIDSYQPKLKILTDLKTLKDIEGKFWNKGSNSYENFIRHYGYDLQLSMYAEIERIANNRPSEDWFIPHMVVVTKQETPDHEVIYFDKEMIRSKLFEVEQFLPRVIQVKNGQAKPVRCEKCDYCRGTKKLKTAKHYSEFDIY